jgi:Uma2 family endonuclease
MALPPAGRQLVSDTNTELYNCVDRPYKSTQFRVSAVLDTSGIPDVMLCPRPLPTGKVMTSAPWAVIEVLSPDDKVPEQLGRFRDYKQTGVRHVVLLDPEQLIAYRFEDGSLLRTQFTCLDLPSGSLPFDTTALFQQLVEELNEG